MSNKIKQPRKIASDSVKPHLKTLFDSLNSILKIIRIVLELINILFLLI